MDRSTSPTTSQPGAWAGVVPLAVTAGAVEPDRDGPVPDDVLRRVAQWGGATTAR